jgi:hypothetical protein
MIGLGSPLTLDPNQPPGDSVVTSVSLANRLKIFMVGPPN